MTQQTANKIDLKKTGVGSHLPEYTCTPAEETSTALHSVVQGAQYS